MLIRYFIGVAIIRIPIAGSKNLCTVIIRQNTRKVHPIVDWMAAIPGSMVFCRVIIKTMNIQRKPT